MEQLDNILKVYPAEFWKEQVVIIGNKSALLKLRDVIDNAVANEIQTCSTFTETDGNTYIVNVIMYGDDTLKAEAWEPLPMHYASEELTDKEKEFLDKIIDNDFETI